MRRLVAAAALLLVLLGELVETTGQQPQPGAGLPAPRLLVVMPTGAKAGNSCEVTVSGTDLDDAEGLYFSQPGIKAELIDTTRPDAKKVSTARFKVVVPPEAALGTHDVRVTSKWGVSNPRAFTIGDLDETIEKEPNSDVEEAQRVSVNATVSGLISTPTDVDYFVFKGEKGQRVVVSCLASSIDSKLPAALQLYGPNGTLLGFNRDYRGADAVLDAALPDNGDYHVRVFSFTYTQGGPEYFYRLSVSTGPWLDAVFPPVVAPGQETSVTLQGRNLPGGKDTLTVSVKAPAAGTGLAFRGHIAPAAAALDGFEYRLKTDAGVSNPFLLTFAQAPVVLDNEKNDTPELAQEITLPCELAGRIEKKRDRDWYAFRAAKGDVYSVEAFGERLGSPLNLTWSLRDAGGKVLFEPPDNNETLTPAQFVTRTEDPARYRFVAPADGTYHLVVTSKESFVQAGPRQMYRVRLVAERPDFQLIVMPPAATSPDAVTVGRGGWAAYTVHVWRLDGFAGEVALAAEDLPAGVKCPPQTIAAGAKSAVLVVGADADAPVWTGALRVTGTATINGAKVVRDVRPATITWPTQANVPAIARLDQGLVLAVREPGPFGLTVTPEPDEVKPGDKVKLTVKADRHWPDANGAIQLSAVSVPAGMTLPTQLGSVAAGKAETTLTLDVKGTVPPGTYPVVLRGQSTVPFSKDPNAKQRPSVAVGQVSVGVIRVGAK